MIELGNGYFKRYRIPCSCTFYTFSILCEAVGLKMVSAMKSSVKVGSIANCVGVTYCFVFSLVEPSGDT